MNYHSIMHLISVPLNFRAHEACLLLERKGRRFCVDFGYMSAEAIADGEFPGWEWLDRGPMGAD